MALFHIRSSCSYEGIVHVGHALLRFIYGILSVHEMSAGMNLEFVFSFNRDSLLTIVIDDNDRVFVLGWGIHGGVAVLGGVKWQGLAAYVAVFNITESGRFIHHEMPFQRCVWRFAAAASTFCILTDRYLIDNICRSPESIYKTIGT